MTASPLLVLERAVEVHERLDAAGVPHAIGGALALAYHVSEARATRDIDLNVLADAAEPEQLFDLLPDDVAWTKADARSVRESGQVRLLWPHPDGQPPIPLDLFFAVSPFHQRVHRRTVLVAMLDTVAPILSATDLLVFKVIGARRKDWADIEELLRHGSPDLADARRWLARIVGADDHRVATLDELVAETKA